MNSYRGQSMTTSKPNGYIFSKENFSNENMTTDLFVFSKVALNKYSCCYLLLSLLATLLEHIQLIHNNYCKLCVTKL